MGIFSFLTHKKPDILKEMGFVNDQDGIIYRYAREKKGWDIHLNNSKQAILEAIETYKPTTAAILGSGWLLDIPLEELSRTCSKIYLYDIIHPTQIKHKVSKYRNIEIIECDITGGAIQKAWEEVQLWKSEGKSIDLKKIPGNGFKPLHQTDMIVSLNILNQLDILICDYLLDNTTLTEDEITNLRLDLQQKHINSLQEQSFCLISDIEERTTDLDSKATAVRPLVIAPLPQTLYKKEWEWQFDSSGSYYDGKRVTFNVVALF